MIVSRNNKLSKSVNIRYIKNFKIYIDMIYHLYQITDISIYIYQWTSLTKTIKFLKDVVKRQVTT